MAEDLAALWRAQQLAPFPPGGMKLQSGGRPLLKLDAAVGAILTGCLRTDGIPRPLPAEKHAELAACRVELERALADLPLDPESRTYFSRLEILAAAVLRG